MTKDHLTTLAALIKKVTADPRLNTSHLSLYLALLASWENQEFIQWFRVSRKELMRLSRIASTSTYHFCLKSLVTFGYIRYEPNYDYYQGSRVTMIG